MILDLKEKQDDLIEFPNEIINSFKSDLLKVFFVASWIYHHDHEPCVCLMLLLF